MAFWHCPHCGTPQPEASRCWVCRRSSTTCGACRHYRRGVAGQLGYCALDRRRDPLRGDEIRGCWEAPKAVAGTTATRDRPLVTPPTARTWTEVGAPPPAQGEDPSAPEAGLDAPEMPFRSSIIDPPPVGFWGDSEV